MEVIVTLLLVALGFFLYQADKSNKEVLRLKEERRKEQNALPVRPQPKPVQQQPQVIREVIVEKPVIIHQPVPSSPPPQPLQLNSAPRFVSVIFKKGDRKRYDYFLGNLTNVNIDDFVVVPVHDKFTDKNTIKVARVKYVSSPGEVSAKAKSTVLRKADRRMW